MLTTVVAFALGGRQYAVPLTSVHRIVRMVEVTPLPKAPEIVLGVVNVQGAIVPVLSIRKRFGSSEPETSLSDQLIIAQTATRRVALPVDYVLGLVELSSEQITNAERVVPGAEYIEGIAKLEDGLLLIHNLDRFLHFEEEKQLQEHLAKA